MKYKTYLAGPIDRVNLAYAKAWRTRLTTNLAKLGIGVLNPFGKAGGDRIGEDRDNLILWNKEGEIEEIRNLVRYTIIPPDLKMVEECSFLTLYIPKSGSEICGSYGEATLAFYLGKPVYIVTKRKLNPVRLPSWIVGCSVEIFTNWTDYLEFIKKNWVK